MRRYGFAVDEITAVAEGGNLDLDVDPKLAWALANRGRFPVDVNRADRETLLRVPGFGVRTVDRLIETRRQRAVGYADLARLGAVLKRAKPFIACPGWSPGALTDSADLRARFAPAAEQLSLF